MLETKGLTKYFGGLCAIGDLDLTIGQDEIVGLIGPNGAGKTTVFNLVTGFLRPSSGRIALEGKDIVGRKPHEIASQGMVRTFQLTSVFQDFTVLRNMQAASHLDPKVSFWEAIFYTAGYRRKEEEIRSKLLRILGFVGLSGVRDVVARNLPHGHLKMLCIAIALAANPKLLLLDEPLEGMNASEVDATLEIISEIRKQGTSILLIEHNMRAVMTICDRLMVLNFGKEIAQGSPSEVQNNPQVIQAYLGEEDDAADLEEH
jgi:branched-chain amino acid transport system ATP-binding protein